MIGDVARSRTTAQEILTKCLETRRPPRETRGLPLQQHLDDLKEIRMRLGAEGNTYGNELETLKMISNNIEREEFWKRTNLISGANNSL